MKTNKKPETYVQKWKQTIQKKKKRLKRKTFFLKAKIFLTIILPIFIIILTVKTAQTWIHLKLKSITLPAAPPKIRPVNLEKAEKEFITPEPAKNRN